MCMCDHVFANSNFKISWCDFDTMTSAVCIYLQSAFGMPACDEPIRYLQSISWFRLSRVEQLLENILAFHFSCLMCGRGGEYWRKILCFYLADFFTSFLKFGFSLKSTFLPFSFISNLCRRNYLEKKGNCGESMVNSLQFKHTIICMFSSQYFVVFFTISAAPSLSAQAKIFLFGHFSVILP